MYDKHAENLKLNFAMAFGMPPNLREAWNAWIDSVEERLKAFDDSGYYHRLPMLEKTVDALHVTLSLQPSMPAVQKVVAANPTSPSLIADAQPAKPAEQSKPEGNPAELAKSADKPVEVMG